MTRSGADQVYQKFIGRIPLLGLDSTSTLLSSDNPLNALLDILAENHALQVAIAIASPTLSTEIQNSLKNNQELSYKAFLHSLTYVLRAGYRPTPYGLFASVGIAEFGSNERPLKFHPELRYTRTRVDMATLLSWIDLRSIDETRLHLYTYSLNVYISSQQDLLLTQALRWKIGDSDDDGQRRMLRIKPLLQDILQSLQPKFSFPDLNSAMMTHGFTEQTSIRMIKLLIESWVIIPLIWLGSPNTSFANLAHLFREDASTAESLSMLAKEVNLFDDLAWTAKSMNALSVVTKSIQTAFQSQSKELHVDTYHQFEGRLPDSVKGDVHLLARFADRTHKKVDQSSLVAALRSHYEGHERLIPILDLIGPKRTVDPLSYSTIWKADQSSDNDVEAIADDILRTIVSRKSSLELTDTAVDKYLNDKSVSPPVGSVEIGFHLLAKNVTALNNGVYQIVPSYFPPVAGAMRSAARFQELSCSRSVEDPRASSYKEQDVEVAFSFLPRNYRASNVINYHSRKLHTLALGASAFSNYSDNLDIRKIYLGIEGEQIFIYSSELGCRIKLINESMVDLIGMLPPCCKFLAGIIEPVKFSLLLHLKVLDSFQYLPRITYQKLIIRRSRLLLRRQEFLLNSKSDLWLRRNLEKWSFRETFSASTDGLSPLPLNLEKMWCFEILVDQARRSKANNIILEELLPSAEASWFKGNRQSFNLEIISSVKQPEPLLATEKPRNRMFTNSSSHVSEYNIWHYVKVYMPGVLMNAVLLNQLKPLINEQRQYGNLAQWFFIRYKDPAPHLRIRFLPAPTRADALKKQVDDFVASLVDNYCLQRWSVESYLPEIQRYGGEQSLNAIHSLFEQSSDAILNGAIGLLGTSNDLKHLATLGIQIRHLAGNSLLTWIDELRPPLRKLPKEWASRSKALSLELGTPVFQSADYISTLSALIDLHSQKSHQGTLREIVKSLVHMHFNRLGLSGNDEMCATAAFYRALRSAHIRASSSSED